VKLKIGILIMLMALGFNRSYCNFNKADSIICDTGQLTIAIECIPTFEGMPLQDEDLIVALYEYDTIMLTDTIHYHSMSDNLITFPAQNLELIGGSINHLGFSIFPSSGSCRTFAVNYHVNDLVSGYCYAVIDTMDASSYTIAYPDHTICLGTDSVFPVTDVPDHAITYNSDSLSCLADEGVIIPSNCRPGNYTVFFSSEYCLSADYFDVSILDQVLIDLPDTIILCSGESMANEGVYSEFVFYSPDYFDEYDYSDITSDGYYVVDAESTECSVPDTVFVQISESPIVSFTIQDECDRVIVGFEGIYGPVENLGWTNGTDDNQIEIYDDGYIGITLMNESGCITSDSVYIEVEFIEVPDVQYDKEDATCWLEGNINIVSASVNNNVGAVTYRLHNTINNSIYDNLDQIPEGLYNLEVVDERDCIAAYSEQIAVLQKCLEDYPVFTPNGDDIEDTYFIPYEGTVEIFNLDGTLLRELNTPAYWDGNDDSGNPLPMGTYVIVTDNGRIVNITIIK